MNRQPKIGLLPLYLELYDKTQPELRKCFEPFLETIVNGFVSENVQTVRAKICRLASEFHTAVQQFRDENVDLIVTVHLAYSPSLEVIDALRSAGIPILILDTTPDYDFGLNVDPAKIMMNHGIHGVQDLACMMHRKEIPYEIVAGHVSGSNVLKRAAGVARAACAARILYETRALRVGKIFEGMGDFSVPDQLLSEVFGTITDEITAEDLFAEIQAVSSENINQEIRFDHKQFRVDILEQVHKRSVRVGLGLRQVLAKGNYNAFSVNFLAFQGGPNSPETVPFLEISKAMQRGLGYAGEGDLLTACLVGALNGAFGRTTFTEIFCPDWKGESLFISHMGEINPAVAEGKALLCEKEFPWTPAGNPAVLTCAPAPGPAVLVNLAPGPASTFHLIIAPVEVLPDTNRPEFQSTVRGWIRPRCPLPEFLEQYSRAGGTHHSALILGDQTEFLNVFAVYAGLNKTIIS
ncbi:MAG TPA: hypothetical protein PLZ55_00255 [bacterium]|nr:hypothetical protein [bacterium]HPO07069.1 hypothetical protein [bacterium]